MKKYVIGFDFGGVIGGGTKLKDNYVASISKALDVSKEEYRKVYFEHNHLINTGIIESWQEFWKTVLEKIDKQHRFEEVMRLTNQISSEFTEVDQNMLEYVGQLRSRGFKVGLLSNATKDVGKELRAKNLHKHFDSFLISAEIGLQKPDPRAFQALVDSLGSKIEDLIFIDDTEKSLSTSKESGYTPILFQSLEKLKEDLEEMF